MVKVPDSITSFEFSAVAMNDVNGIGLTDKPISVRVFKDFFIELSMPFNCKRSEIVSLDILLFSFVNFSQNVTLGIGRNDREFTVLQQTETGWSRK